MVRLTSTFDNQAPDLVQLSNGTILLFWSVNVTASYAINYMSYNNAAWSNPVQITPMNDSAPAATVDRAGTLWLFWTRQTLTPCGIFPCRQIFYKTLKNGAWSPEVQLTADPTYNKAPSAMVAKDGRLWVAYQKWVPNQFNYQLFYRIYNGTAWGSDIQLTSKLNWDERPSLLQDRNGTIWTYWDRELQITSTTFESKIYNKFSLDNGVTWSSDTQMTFDTTPTLIDDVFPSAVQGTDKSIWLFYSSDLTGLGADFDIYYMTSSCICPVHDVKVVSARASPGTLYAGGLKSVNQSSIVNVVVTLANLGDFPETMTLTVSAFNTTSYKVFAGTLPFPVASGGGVILTFYWNTSATFLPGRYGISAFLNPVTSESIGNQGDNLLMVKNLVHFLPFGDVDQDGAVTILDFSVAAFGYLAPVGTPKYNPYADINGNGVIDIVDIAVVAKNYNTFT
jgi:hypothetical protein